MTRVLFLLMCLCLPLALLAACSKEPATAPANPNTPAAATPLATPNTVATPVAVVTPTPNAATAAAANDTAWQKDFNALVPFMKRQMQAGANPEDLISNQTVQWNVTFRKYIPGSTDPNAMSPHPVIDFAEAEAAAKGKPWIQLMVLAKDSESDKLKSLQAGQKISLRCQMAGVTVTEKNEKKGRTLQGMVLSAEECVVGN